MKDNGSKWFFLHSDRTHIWIWPDVIIGVLITGPLAMTAWAFYLKMGVDYGRHTAPVAKNMKIGLICGASCRWCSGSCSGHGRRIHYGVAQND